ncbi:F-box protein At2g17036-like [Elaeis guineensis]|uniref:F-box protein At2g17036-like n=1 Tax=Elaeis guineensis var. tenera TaxID=51953 RepID=UPI003C6CF780
MFQVWRDSDWVLVDGNEQRESVLPGDARMSTEFVIFKLDERRNDWSAVKDLGDLALFLGLNRSMALSTREFPQLASSCFNFTDDYRDGCMFEQQAIRDIGVFDLKYGSFRRYDSHLTNSEWNWPPQIWIMPALRLSQVCSPQVPCHDETSAGSSRWDG